ncbi:type II toxin-antitoxin system VapC family toxin [soil metagenome]
MSNIVLDSWALMALLNREEPAASRVRALLYEAKQQQINIFLSLVNLGEIYYIVGRRRGNSVAEETVAGIHTLPLTILPIDEATVIQAARYKMLYPISYADAFAVAAAFQQNAMLVTGDPEFDKLQGIVKIEMLQRNT